MNKGKEAIAFLHSHIEKGLLNVYGNGKEFEKHMKVLEEIVNEYDKSHKSQE